MTHEGWDQFWVVARTRKDGSPSYMLVTSEQSAKALRAEGYRPCHITNDAAGRHLVTVSPWSAANIPIAQSPEPCQILSGAMAEVHSLDDLTARVAKMRELGVTKWGDIELGPEPTSAESDETQRTTAPDEKAMRAARQRLAFAASGGSVKSAGRP